MQIWNALPRIAKDLVGLQMETANAGKSLALMSHAIQTIAASLDAAKIKKASLRATFVEMYSPSDLPAVTTLIANLGGVKRMFARKSSRTRKNAQRTRTAFQEDARAAVSLGLLQTFASQS